VELGRLPDLIDLLASTGHGVSLMPVRKGQRRGGFGSDLYHESDGWEVGMIDPNGGEDISVGPTIAEAVDLALLELSS